MNMLLYQILAFNIYGKSNKIKISALTGNEEFELPGGSYSVSDIQEYFEYIIQKHVAVTNDPSIKIYVNKMNIQTGLLKTEYYLEILTPETMKLK